MHLVTQVRLFPSKEQANLLQTTLERCNKACSWISEQAVEHGIFNKTTIQRMVYSEVRSRFGLGAQATVRCIAKVAASHKVGKRSKPRRFHQRGAQPYDPRILSWGKEHVSIWTIDRRIKVPFRCNKWQQKRLETRVGEVDLVKTNTGKWLLLVPCKVEENPKTVTTEFLGVDLGIVNLAADSDGEIYSGKSVDLVRRKYGHRRRNLQRKSTKSAKRKLKKISGREARFRRDVNHQISKALVFKAQRTGRGISLEDLQGIRNRVTARRRQRARLHCWSFHQQRKFIEYKALLAGIYVVTVDPAYTSQTCPECSYVSRKNRPTRDRFCCESCGHAGPADHIAARNISFRARAAVNRPNGFHRKKTKVPSSRVGTQVQASLRRDVD
jgi:putative transposase